MRRHTIYDELDPFDTLDDVDGFDGFIIEDEAMDDPESVWYRGVVVETVFCDWGCGDEEGLCVKERFGCAIEGCPHADHPW